MIIYSEAYLEGGFQVRLDLAHLHLHTVHILVSMSLAHSVAAHLHRGCLSLIFHDLMRPKQELELVAHYP